MDQEGPLLAVESPSNLEGKPEIIPFTTQPIRREEANAVLRTAGLTGLFNVSLVEMVETIPVLGSGKTDYRRLLEGRKIA